MSNIYNDSSEPIREAGGPTNGNFANITVQNLIAQNAAIDNLNVDGTTVVTGIDITSINNHAVLTAGVNGSVNGLMPGANNEIMVSNGLDALWTNSLTLQDLQTNTLKIPTTVNGDLLVFNNLSQAQRLGVGTSGQFLISDGTNPTWNALPNPLIVGGLQVNNNFQLSAFPNRTLITDGTGFIVSEQAQYMSGSATINQTPAQIYGVVSWIFTLNAWYSLKVQVNGGIGSSFGGKIMVDVNTIGNINSLGSNTFYCEFTYNHLMPTGVYAMVLTDFLTGVGNMDITYSIRVERIPIPNIHV